MAAETVLVVTTVVAAVTAEVATAAPVVTTVVAATVAEAAGAASVLLVETTTK